MKNIFNAANSISLGHELSIASAQALSGRIASNRRGPYVYTFDVEVNTMSTTHEEYHLINKDLRAINYGVETALVSLPNGLIPEVRGSFDGSPVINGTDQTGRVIEMNGFGFSKTNVIRDGDFVQFTNSSKVFQAVGDFDSNTTGEIVASGTTNKGLKLNNAVIVSPVTGTSLNTGPSVKFKLYLVKYDDPTLTPGSGGSIFASWGVFQFKEAI